MAIITNEALAAAGIDVEPTLSRFMNDPENLYQNLGMFVGAMPMVRMQKALDANDGAMVERVFSSVASSATNVGLTAVAAACSSVVEAQQAGDDAAVRQNGAAAIAKAIIACDKIRRLGK